MKKILSFISLILILVLCGCSNVTTVSKTDTDSSTSTTKETTVTTVTTDKTEREVRVLDSSPTIPTNETMESSMQSIDSSLCYEEKGSYFLMVGKYYLEFKLSSSLLGYYVEIKEEKTNNLMYTIDSPAKLYLKGLGQVSIDYDDIDIKSYGIKATATIVTEKGSRFIIEDRYYFAKEDVQNSINIERTVNAENIQSGETNYESVFGINTSESTSNIEWFIPNEINGEYPSGADYRIYRETLTGLPMTMFRNTKTGYTVSLSRYQPVIDYDSNSYACVGAFFSKTSSGDDKSSIEINYPTRDTARRYFNSVSYPQIVYDMSIIIGSYASFSEAEVDCYKKQYTLQDQRIVDTDIDEVYKVINEDFKKFMLTNKANGITSYGLPWRVTISNGLIGPMSLQAGFVGQQIPCAYNMMVYGIKNNDKESLNNGINIINFWVNEAKFMSDAGVPKIWFFGWDNTWAGYPTFTRMAVDAMEGLLDAYRLASKYNIETKGWKEAIISCADFFVKAQNTDGSWYRCYNYQGTYYKGTESDIWWNPGDIARSTSKNNTTMPIRFLGKIYELTKDNKYYNAVIKAGDYVYQNLYPQNVYYGGTCDNPDAIDKEAGVYAMYAYDTLYTLTKDKKWLPCLEQAAIFTMSSVLTVSFKISSNSTDNVAAIALKYGYTDGLSYICIGGTSLDNYAAYIYYELFRTYIYTGDKTYYHMAEFIQQNTKSTMDWDGKLGYSYKSLTPEASTIWSFGFSSAKDDDGVEGVWLPWQSAANAEPIAKMCEVFGSADVREFENTSILDLLSILDNFGVGGNEHKSID